MAEVSYNDLLIEFNGYLDELYPKTSLLNEAAYYALSSGGKRVRPLLVFATAGWLKQDVYDTFPIAAAVESIHSYSLIHDDLPEMDNDELRRGKPTVHKKYGHGLALLVGDMLLSDCYEELLKSDLSDKAKLFAIQKISSHIGGKGTVKGQYLDSLYSGENCDIIRLEKIHQLKTGALISASGESPFGMVEDEIYIKQLISRFCRFFGLAFQVHNDLKDVLLTKEETGKEVHHDADLDKATYPKILGVTGAIDRLSQLNEKLTEITNELAELVPNAQISRSIYQKCNQVVSAEKLREYHD